MMRSVARVGSLVAFLCATSCGTLEDAVFEAQLIEFETESLSVPEHAGEVQVSMLLGAPASSPVRVSFEVTGIEAQDDCQQPDFRGVPGTLTFEAGSSMGSVGVWIEDDELAELDERLQIVVREVSGATLVGVEAMTITIEDDDRDGILEAENYGVVPNATLDQTEELQAALNASGALGRGVLKLAPGSYQVTGLELPVGTTLSGWDATLLRSTASDDSVHTLSVLYGASEDSAPTLVEGVTLDGQRDQQGPFQDFELEDSHLLAIAADPEHPGRLSASVQGVTLVAGTGDGIAVGPGTTTELCRIQAQDIWRDAIGLHGGGTTLSVRGLTATASLGTSGILLEGDVEGYAGVRAVDVEIEEARLDTGDVEVEVVDGSRVVFRRLLMTEAPFRLMAPDSQVEIIDSIIQLGVPSERHNNLTFAHDVSFVGSTIYASEKIDEQSGVEEEDRELATISLRWATDDEQEPAAGEHLVQFDNCRFELGPDIEPEDTVYAVSNPGPVGRVVVRRSLLGAGFADWFAPGCVDCRLE